MQSTQEQLREAFKKGMRKAQYFSRHPDDYVIEDAALKEYPDLPADPGKDAQKEPTPHDGRLSLDDWSTLAAFVGVEHDQLYRLGELHAYLLRAGVTDFSGLPF